MTPNKYRISFCTTCMGRLNHVRETLIRNIEDNKRYGKVEFVLLNYNSPDKLDSWVQSYCRRYIEQGILKYYHTTEPKFFHMAHAKNVAHLLATGDIVCNLDGDNYTGVDYADHLNDIFAKHPASCVRSLGGDSGSGGRITLRREDFILMGGYDEAMVGWGLEDADLWQRSKRNGLSSTFSYGQFCKCIEHDHDIRECYHTPPGEEKKDIDETKRRNHGIFTRNRRMGKKQANDTIVWGKAECRKNFLTTVHVGSHLVNGRKEPPPLRQPTILPVLPTDSDLPPKPSIAPPLPRSTPLAGKFIISKLRTKQTNERVK